MTIMVGARSIGCVLVIAIMACGSTALADVQQPQPCVDAASSMRQQRFAALVCMRVAAIETAFGALFDGVEVTIHVEFVAASDPKYPQGSMSSYDPARHTLYFRRTVLTTSEQGWPSWALSYWPYYYSDAIRAEYPTIEIVDAALWEAHQRWAAHERGLAWPHEDCGAIDIARRLGCEMLVSATSERIRSLDGPLFNANRVDRLWPDDLKGFERRAWIRDGREYREVRRLGGLLLIDPLIREFGALRVLAYVARTPFRIEDGNVRVSALRYQTQARSALAW